MGWRDKLLEELQVEGVAIVAMKHILDRATTSKDLSAGALSFTTTVLDKWRISQVLVHSSVVLPATTITVKFNSSDGANYDVLIGALDFNGEQDLAFISGNNLMGVSGEVGDEITVESNGSDVAGTLYVTIMYEILI